jgi:hypothetical protein
MSIVNDFWFTDIGVRVAMEQETGLSSLKAGVTVKVKPNRQRLSASEMAVFLGSERMNLAGPYLAQ